MRPTARTLYFSTWIAVTLLVGMVIQLLGTGEHYHRDNQERSPDAAALEQVAHARAQVIQDLIAGRRSLFEAANRFRELSAECPVDVLPFLRILHPDRSDDELHYLHVLMHVNGACRQNGTDETIVGIFRQEFEARRTAGTLTTDCPGACSGVPLATPPATPAPTRR